ncbi:peptidyl-prolyl cis-trans isomerase FKBP16-3, chloroplastic [Populus alba]|uniref:peptidyl-prolyl cis-trans isomerase FKBP16-3, chloroplastic n=1 Tax=Populus alba TaxID=43335 RepID=UPI003CC78745
MASSSPSSLLLPLGSSSGKTTKRHGTINVFDKVQGLMNINSKREEDGYKFDEEKRSCNWAGIRGSSLCNIGLFDDIAKAAGLPPEDKPRLCDENCEKELENVPMVTTESGLQFKDIKLGQGPSPPVGFQVAANYVAMVPTGQIFDSSLEKGQLYICRVGSDQVIKGLDEGILSMKVGGKRRLYIPGLLAFPKGLTSAPGRPRVAPNSPVVFDVSLEYIPGLEVEEE